MAAPLNMYMVASDTMMSGIPSVAMIHPLMKPHSIPANIPAKIAAGIGTPLSIRIHVTVAVRLTTEPIERSIPPKITTMVIPIPMIAIEVDWLRISAMFFHVKNSADMKLNTANSTTIRTTIEISDLKFLFS